MGPRLLCFVGGAALTAYFVLLGLLATPFFGAGSFLWAMVFAAFLVALAAGQGLGTLLARAMGARNLEHAAPRLAVAGGLLAWASAYLLPEVCRAVLDRDPSFQLAPLVAMVAVSLLPGALIAAIVPSEVRVRVAGSEGKEAATAQAALRLTGLMTLGGVAGILLCAKPLLHADQVDVYVFAYLTGGLLAALGLAFLGLVWRVGGALGIVAMVALCVAKPSELQEEAYAVAMKKSWRANQTASAYYLRTTDSDRLSAAELEAKAKAAAATEKHGVIVTLEMLDALGAVSVTGEGLCRTLDLMLSPGSKPFLMPIFRQLESVRSDGKGILFCQIKRKKGEEGAKFEVPGANPGEKVQFWFRDDFTIRMEHTKSTWKLEFGPITVTPAGVLEFHDTKSTPLRILNVVAWVDASLLGIVIEDQPTQVAIKAVAQGDIGDVKVKDVITLQKDSH
ncbi:MAG: hypothetical protein AB7N76_18125 [Planctomycetota bacterium]